MSDSIDDAWRCFLNFIGKMKSIENLDEAFGLFLTFEERKAIADRYNIVKELLKEEKTQRVIAEDLQVSIAKITRGSNSLKTISEKQKKLLKKMMF